jgi:NTE family protein
LKKNFTLVFSGGSALGYAHIGVYKYFEEYKYVPKEISGTSMGALIASLIAIGYSSTDIENLAKKFSNPLSLFSFDSSLTNIKSKIVGNKKIIELLKSIFKDKKIGETNIPLYISATNFNTGENIIFNKDILIYKAVMASISIPGIFPPITINNEIYVDGYLSQNLPISPMCYKYPIVAIDVLSLKSLKDINKNWKKLNILNILERNFRLFIIAQTKENLKKRFVSHLINIDTSDFKTSDFKKYNEIIEVGYKSIKNSNIF